MADIKEIKFSGVEMPVAQKAVAEFYVNINYPYNDEDGSYGGPSVDLGNLERYDFVKAIKDGKEVVIYSSEMLPESDTEVLYRYTLAKADQMYYSANYGFVDRYSEPLTFISPTATGARTITISGEYDYTEKVYKTTGKLTEYFPGDLVPHLIHRANALRRHVLALESEKNATEKVIMNINGEDREVLVACKPAGIYDSNGVLIYPWEKMVKDGVVVLNNNNYGYSYDSSAGSIDVQLTDNFDELMYYGGGSDYEPNYRITNTINLAQIGDSIDTIILGYDLDYEISTNVGFLRGNNMPARKIIIPRLNQKEFPSLYKNTYVEECIFADSWEPAEISYNFNMFEGCINLKKVVLPPIVYGGSNSHFYNLFDGCSSLTDVTLPKKIGKFINYRGETCFRTNIGRIFRNCTSLESVTLMENFSNMAESFSGCTNLKNVIFRDYTDPEPLERIIDGAFYNCTSLSSIVLSDNGNIRWYSTGQYSDPGSLYPTSSVCGIFEGCTSLKTVEIYKLVTKYGLDAKVFKGCPLETIVIKAAVRDPFNGVEIKDAFCGFTTLKNVTLIPDTETGAIFKFTGATFMGCTSLESITIPAGTTSLSGRMFSGCTALREVILPDSLTKIEGSSGYTNPGAFCNCTALKEITIPESVTTIANKSFEGCSDITIKYKGTATGFPWGATNATLVTEF